MFAKLKGNHKGSGRGININPEHVSLVFNRQDRVILRMIDGVEIPLEPEYTDSDAVAAMIHAARVSPFGTEEVESLISKILGSGKAKPDAETK